MDASPPPDAPVPPATTRSVLIRVTGAALVLGLVAWAAYRWSGVATLAAPDPAWLAAGALAWTAGVGVQGLRWRALLPAPRPGVAAVVRTVVGANVLNLTMPGPVGEVVAAWSVARDGGPPLAVAVASSFLARIVAVVVLGVVALVLTPLVGAGAAEPSRVVLVGGLVLGAGASLAALLCAWPEATSRLLARALRRLPRADRLADRVVAAGAELAALGRLPPGAWAAAVGWSVVATFVQSLGSVAAFRAVGLAAGPPTATDLALVYTHVLNSLGFLAVMFVPAGVGAMEAIYVAVLTGLGVCTAGEALVGTVVVRQVQLGSIVLSLWPLFSVLRPGRRRPAPPTPP